MAREALYCQRGIKPLSAHRAAHIAHTKVLDEVVDGKGVIARHSRNYDPLLIQYKWMKPMFSLTFYFPKGLP